VTWFTSSVGLVTVVSHWARSFTCTIRL
jgi:hypothetical protein